MFGACANIHDMYQSTRLADAQLDASDANGKIVYSTNDGVSWTTLHTFSHAVFWTAIDPNNQNRMYASVIQFGGTQGSQVGGILGPPLLGEVRRNKAILARRGIHCAHHPGSPPRCYVHYRHVCA